MERNYPLYGKAWRRLEPGSAKLATVQMPVLRLLAIGNRFLD